jgi:putative copper resistance protein D
MDNFLYLPRAVAFALFDIAFAATLGSLLALVWLDSSPSSRNHTAAIVASLRQCLIVCALAMPVLLAVQLWLLTATMLGTTSLAEVRGQLMDVLRGTHAGRVLIPQSLIALALLLLLSLRPAIAGKAGIYSALFLVGMLACFRAASGHAASQGDFTFSEVVQFLHLASIAMWAGGVMIAGLMVIPRLQISGKSGAQMLALTDYARRLSLTSTCTYSWLRLPDSTKGGVGLGGSWKALEDTQWGMILAAMALAVGLKNRMTLKRNRTLIGPDARSFSRWVRLEGFAMLAILVLSGFLANSPPVMDS